MSGECIIWDFKTVIGFGTADQGGVASCSSQGMARATPACTHPHDTEDLPGGGHRRLDLLDVAGLAGGNEEAGILRAHTTASAAP